jgi:3-oxoacyl-[acyl-carrier protein] reductase
MIDLTGKHIFIAGGSRGIGAASARMAASAGASVSINYQSNHAAAEQVVADVNAAGGQGFAVAADVAEDGALDRAVDAAVERLGPLHGMVVSAGIFEGRTCRT